MTNPCRVLKCISFKSTSHVWRCILRHGWALGASGIPARSPWAGLPAHVGGAPQDPHTLPWQPAEVGPFSCRVNGPLVEFHTSYTRAATWQPAICAAPHLARNTPRPGNRWLSRWIGRESMLIGLKRVVTSQQNRRFFHTLSAPPPHGKDPPPEGCCGQTAYRRTPCDV